MACSSSSADKVDRISVQPDEVLNLVLSKCSIKDAVRTSILSTRWKDLWKCIPILNLNQSSICQLSRNHGIFISGGDIASNDNEQLALRHTQASQFANTVDWILNQYMGRLEVLVVDALLDARYELRVRRWIDFAMALGASTIKLTLRVVGEHNVFDNPITVDARKLDGLEQLNLTRVSLLLPCTSVSFRSLTVLRLDYVQMNDDKVSDLVRGCPVLGSLHIMFCPMIDFLKLANPTVKEVTIKDCIALHRVELSCPNLSSLDLSGCDTKIGWLNTPNIENLSYAVSSPRYPMKSVCKDLISYTTRWSHLTSLSLSLEKIPQQGQFGWFPFVAFGDPNLRNIAHAAFLKTIEGYLYMIFLLMASPFLQRFELKFPCNAVNNDEYVMLRTLPWPASPRTDLRRVRFSGFSASDVQVQLVEWILENAIDLKAIEIQTIHPSTRNSLPYRTAFTHIRRKLRPGCRLNIL